MMRRLARSTGSKRQKDITDRIPDKSKLSWFRKKLKSWFVNNKRDFPWRTSKDPYVICISEIFLQQTSAKKVAEIIRHFTEKYPSWNILAAAPVEEIETTIKPLGLFRQRAQTLHQLANIIVKKGGLPSTRQGLENLPGIGQYIANVLLVVLQNKREPFLDVNMSRVLERFFGPREMADIRDDPYLQVLSRKVVNVEDALSANWMVLDFAAAVCTKRKPVCLNCPLLHRCKYTEKPHF